MSAWSCACPDWEARIMMVVLMVGMRGGSGRLEKEYSTRR